MDSNASLTAADIAKVLQCSSRSVERAWRKTKTFPPPDYRNGNVALWKKETLDAWMRLWPWLQDALKSSRKRTGTDNASTLAATFGQLEKPA